ncbi:MAG: 3-oxoadipate enol-lactonase [Caldilineaceae bacterium]
MSITRFVTVGQYTLHYRLDGVGAPGTATGTPLVFINSLGSDLRIWDGLIAAFAPHYPIIRYDKRGHGLSDCPPGPYTLRDHTADLAGLLAGLQMRSAILIGVSVGGMIALDFAHQYPERVQGLVLCDTGAKIGTADYWTERSMAVRQGGLASLAPTILARWFSSTFAEAAPAAYRGYTNMLTRTPLEGYAATCEALRDADLRAVVTRIGAPALVLCGDEDQATPPSLGQALADALPNARFALIPQAGHIPSIEQPQALTTAIQHFLEEIHHG